MCLSWCLKLCSFLVVINLVWLCVFCVLFVGVLISNLLMLIILMIFVVW